jgi:hypothetical protein
MPDMVHMFHHGVLGAFRLAADDRLDNARMILAHRFPESAGVNRDLAAFAQQRREVPVQLLQQRIARSVQDRRTRVRFMFR